MTLISIPSWYYQHFDADFSRAVPEEGFGGWKKTSLEYDLDKMALVVMHAWNHGIYADFPGWYRCVPYIPRAQKILRDVFPQLLYAFRHAGISVFHVVGGGNYYQHLPGYQHAQALVQSKTESKPQITPDPVLQKLREFRKTHVHPGLHNADDVRKGFENIDFAPEARPFDTEGIAENGDQLFALCEQAHVTHLIYCGFAIDFCLLLAPGGMADMASRGFLCSVIKEATTAVENKETAETEMAKELGLWRVALLYGFVFELEDLLAAIKKEG